MKIEELYIYPIKSGRSQSLKEMKITIEGPEGDRQWMLVDEAGKFISQRTLPKLATVEVFHEETALTIGFQKMFFKISKNNSLQRKIKVQVWDDSFEAALEPDLYSQALTQYLGVNCRLVRYAGGRPLQLVSSKSLEELNARLSTPVNLDRFRANIVFSGNAPYEEEQWKRIRIGDVVFSHSKKTLATSRRDDKEAFFGTLWIPENRGLIKKGDGLEVLE